MRLRSGREGDAANSDAEEPRVEDRDGQDAEMADADASGSDSEDMSGAVVVAAIESDSDDEEMSFQPAGGDSESDEEEDASDSDEMADAIRPGHNWIQALLSRFHRSKNPATRRNPGVQPLPKVPVPLNHPELIAMLLSGAHDLPPVCRRAGRAAVGASVDKEAEVAEGAAAGGSSGTSEASGEGEGAVAAPVTPPRAPPAARGGLSMRSLLRLREQGLAADQAGTGCTGSGALCGGQRRYLGGCAVPDTPAAVIDEQDSRGYCVRYSMDGNLCAAAFQGRRVRVYDVSRGYQLVKDVQARMLQWTITDCSMSPDGRFLAYASITPAVHLVGLQGGELHSVSNVTEVHDCLYMSEGADRLGVWACRWSPDGADLLAGTSDCCAIVYDVEARRCVASTNPTYHDDDLNTVSYMGGMDSNVFVTGSDDHSIKVWDKRTLGGASGGGANRPVGLLLGHTEGVCHTDPLGDGRYLLSNGKDQCARLWDIRRMHDGASDVAAPGRRPRYDVNVPWDYRWEKYPLEGYHVAHPHDCSVMRYHGHKNLATLIRAYFSPADSTGRRYIYTGSYDGAVRVYDAVTGGVHRTLRFHKQVVRDVAWHPTLPELVTTSFDGTVVLWGTDDGMGAWEGERATQRELPRPGRDKLRRFWD
ncbi:unnamed protein product [Pedinophyceae sp. YPF-701]|nr:unnamed protein product [Pedinophyceae sp. YPF-701]